jgi:hypothetical protein
MKHHHSIVMAVLIAVTFAATLSVASQMAGEVIAQEMGNTTADMNMTAGGNMTGNMTAGGNWTTPSSNMTS